MNNPEDLQPEDLQPEDLQPEDLQPEDLQPEDLQKEIEALRDRHSPESSPIRVSAAGRHRVPDAGRTRGQRGAGVDLRAPAAKGLGAGEQRRRAAHADRRQRPAPQAGGAAAARSCPGTIFTEPRAGYWMAEGIGRRRRGNDWAARRWSPCRSPTT